MQGISRSFVSFTLKYSHFHCFLDFVDKFLLPKSGASVRVVNQLLTEMDGLENRQQVFIMAATNRPGKDPKVINKKSGVLGSILMKACVLKYLNSVTKPVLYLKLQCLLKSKAFLIS